MSQDLSVFKSGRTSCFPKVYDHASPEISSLKAIGAFGAANPYLELSGSTRSGGWEIEAGTPHREGNRITITLDARAKTGLMHNDMITEFDRRIDLPRLPAGTYEITLKDFAGKQIGSTKLTMLNPY
jgi:hypothetical protein